VNCPFDDEYRPLLRAAIFTVQACGFTARIALENTGSEGVRLDRLVKIIGECELGIHDLSRVRAVAPAGLPRFNMPFECGDDKPEKLIACVRDFLSAGLDPKPIGPTAIIVLYNNFVSALPAIAPEADLTLADIEPLTAFNDWYLLAARWLQQQAAGKH
jgi:hypothetical protein